MMESLSTSWHGLDADTGISIVERAHSLDFNLLELNYHLSTAKVSAIEDIVARGEIRISSVHNYCPAPANIPIQQAGPDCFNLASLDAQERARAVSQTKVTIDLGQRVRARVIVVHAGFVEIENRQRELLNLVQTRGADALEAQTLRDSMRSSRQERLDGHLAVLLDSLDRVVDYAQARGLRVGLENRLYHRELPGPEEFESIFSRFTNGAVCYWHDVGHAVVQERLGLASGRPLIERYGRYLIGMHLHDVLDNLLDHQAPYQGTVDFSQFRRYLRRPEVIKVLELRQTVAEEDARSGWERLRALWTRDLDDQVDQLTQSVKPR